jgi:hypothetical protein
MTMGRPTYTGMSKDASGVHDDTVERAVQRHNTMKASDKFCDLMREAIAAGLESEKPTAVSTISGTKSPHFVSSVRAQRATAK